MGKAEKKDFFRRGMVLLSALVCGGVMTLANGCRSDEYYQNQATEEARTFLVEQCPELALDTQEYIKYNRPFLLVSPISVGYPQGVSQICVTWMVPGEEDLFLVYGVSSNSMMEWSPERVIRKQFAREDRNYFNALNQARNYALQRIFPLLSAADVNHIRFTNPSVWKTQFDLAQNPQSDYSEEELKKALKKTQFSVVWQLQDELERYVVIGGVANEELGGFKVYFGGIFTAEEFYRNQADPVPFVNSSVGTVLE